MILYINHQSVLSIRTSSLIFKQASHTTYDILSRKHWKSKKLFFSRILSLNKTSIHCASKGE